MNIQRLRFVLMIAIATLGLTASANPRIPYGAAPYAHLGITIMPKEIFFDGGKLTVRLLVVNNTGKPLYLDKAQVQLRVGEAVLPRDEGVFGKYAKPGLVGAGLSHPLYVDFRVAAAGPVSVVLAHGFVVDGQSLALPDLPLTPAGG